MSDKCLYVKLKKHRYLDKCRLSAPAEASDVKACTIAHTTRFMFKRQYQVVGNLPFLLGPLDYSGCCFVSLWLYFIFLHRNQQLQQFSNFHNFGTFEKASSVNFVNFVVYLYFIFSIRKGKEPPSVVNQKKISHKSYLF